MPKNSTIGAGSGWGLRRLRTQLETDLGGELRPAVAGGTRRGGTCFRPYDLPVPSQTSPSPETDRRRRGAAARGPRGTRS